jgi:phospholipid/cholesterol/gamma-HCH transport system substrate-binding protein
MQPSPLRDFILGLFILLGFGSIGYLSIQVGGLNYNGPKGFYLNAAFDEIGDLKTHAAVVVAGVKIGEVLSIELDEFLRANCVLDIDPSLGLDVETSASIKTAGLLGEKFIALEPGGSDDMLQSGDAISRTESAISIESLIGKFMNSSDFGEN